MTAEKHKIWQKLSQNPTNQGSQLSLIFQTILKTIRKSKKQGGSRELFLPENDFKTCSAVNFPKNIQILEAWKPIKDIKFRLEFFSHALLHINSI